MGYSLPGYIRGQEELSVYEQFLKNNKPICKNNTETPTKSDPNITLKDFLCLNIGKKVRVATTVGSNINVKIGTLLNVGADFLTIKQNLGITLIGGKNINNITFLN